MKIILSAILALFTLTAPAQVLVYKLKLTVTHTGAGVAIKNNFTGYAIIGDDGEFALVRGHTGIKTLQVIRPNDCQSGNILAPRPLAAVQVKGIETLTGLIAKGSINAKLGYPKTLKLSGIDLFPLGEFWRLEEFTGSLVIDAKRTALAFPFETAIDLARTDLIARGFTE